MTIPLFAAIIALLIAYQALTDETSAAQFQNAARAWKQP